MRYSEFVDKVGEKTGLDSRDEVVQTIEAVLETLGERLTRDEQDHLAAQLPNELKDVVRKRYGADRFMLEDFYNRVRARADMGYPDAVKRSRAVLEVVQLAVSPGEMEDILAELPEEYLEVFGRKEPGPLSPSAVE
jgi:uncharacterized protein (DUF2267 family)